ncbi:cupin 2 domain-containing protein [Pseudomonas sp. TE6288]|uniref:cupin domain-containing protein n=1 Tax=Pseudomonas TaxID=286 RepID=UPI0011199E91|nr:MULTISPECIES: cupin domain-containing protein [Pseudomonas]MBI6952711.1 cupin domain-containing protein [Pseudomonas sp. CCOS 191]MDF9756562.1 cupin 2 domain-containing protein [Pseudomonas hunanensis]UVL17188.1 cupin domain-containing protein [Pseudomonas sp. B21-044]UVM14538.1 cupin domain-containing protein [Pseudomonas sp. B21-023]
MPDNLFTALPPLAPEADEQFTELLRRPGLRIERIVSSGQASPEGFWYDQAEGEWVVVLSGSAGLRLEHETHTRVLRAGDHLDIPPRCRHRVEWTEPGVATVWLAVFYQG